MKHVCFSLRELDCIHNKLSRTSSPEKCQKWWEKESVVKQKQRCLVSAFIWITTSTVSKVQDCSVTSLHVNSVR